MIARERSDILRVLYDEDYLSLPSGFWRNPDRCDYRRSGRSPIGSCRLAIDRKDHPDNGPPAYRAFDLESAARLLKKT
ncbi:hypothetical protein ACNJEG_21200, partial [Mycobacterium tuberculosis]